MELLGYTSAAGVAIAALIYGIGMLLLTDTYGDNDGSRRTGITSLIIGIGIIIAVSAA